jgi:hypothetical protein
LRVVSWDKYQLGAEDGVQVVALVGVAQGAEQLERVGLVGSPIDFGHEVVQRRLHLLRALGAQASHAELCARLQVERQASVEVEQMHAVSRGLEQIEALPLPMLGHHRHVVPLYATQ